MSKTTVYMYFGLDATGYKYKRWYLNPDCNEIIDDLDDYLATFNCLYDPDMNHIKIALEIDLKLDLTQFMTRLGGQITDQSQFGNYSVIGPKYVVIDQDSMKYYFYVTDYRWISQAATSLHLRLDVLNTFKWYKSDEVSDTGTDPKTYLNGYTFADENHVIREHKDRWKLSDDETKVYRVIDVFPENIESEHIKLKEQTVYDEELEETDREMSWYLLYMNQEDPTQVLNQPVCIYLMPEKTLSFEDMYNPLSPNTTFDPDRPGLTTGGSDMYITESQMVRFSGSSYTGQYMSVLGCLYNSEYNTERAHTPSIQLYDGDTLKATITLSTNKNAACYFDIEGDLVNALLSIRVATSEDGETFTTKTYDYDYYANVIIIDDGNHGCYCKGSTTIFGYYNRNNDAWLEAAKTDTTICRSFSFTPKSFNGIDWLDRTDNRFIKLIKLPYCPVSLSVAAYDSSDNPVYAISDELDDGSNAFNCNVLNTAGKIVESYYIVAHCFNKYQNACSRNMTTNYTDLYDKLVLDKSKAKEETSAGLTYNDLFWNVFEHYDNASELIFAAEVSCWWNESWNVSDTEVFWPGAYFESKLLNSQFSYEKLVYDSFNMTINYEAIKNPLDLDENIVLNITDSLAVNYRELVIFPYELIRQNEDYSGIMIINRSNEEPLFNNEYISYLKTGYNYDVKAKNLSLGQDIASSFTNMFSIGSLANPVSIASGAIKSGESIAFSQMSKNNEMARTVAEKQYETSSVSGSDDLGLLSVYTNNNKYKWIDYGVRDEIYMTVYNIFRLTGYACSHYGDPEMENRVDFNYAKCETALETYGAISQECIDEIKKKWNEGVYKIHRIGETFWDCGLQSSNIEKWLVDKYCQFYYNYF